MPGVSRELQYVALEFDAGMYAHIFTCLIGRDGEAFLNLISVVPIRWKEISGEEKEYYVGFQVDVRIIFRYSLSVF